MTDTIVLKAEKRTKLGTRVSRKTREQGRIPAIIYGHKQTPEAVTLDYHDLMLELHHHHRLLTVDLYGSQAQYLVKDVQYNYLGDHIIHVDLTRVDKDERVTVEVEVVLKGEPKGVHAGGHLDQLLADIALECPAVEIPESLRVSVVDLGAGETLTAGQIELPAGVKLITPSDTPVAIVRIVTEVEEAVVETGLEEGVAEPEVIKREKSDDAEE